jgi:hypothetical protein
MSCWLAAPDVKMIALQWDAEDLMGGTLLPTRRDLPIPTNWATRSPPILHSTSIGKRTFFFTGLVLLLD